jgi:hypothetical protein
VQKAETATATTVSRKRASLLPMYDSNSSRSKSDDPIMLIASDVVSRVVIVCSHKACLVGLCSNRPGEHYVPQAVSVQPQPWNYEQCADKSSSEHLV